MDLSGGAPRGGTAVATRAAPLPGRRPHRTSTPHLLEAEQLIGYLSLPGLLRAIDAPGPLAARGSLKMKPFSAAVL